MSRHADAFGDRMKRLEAIEAKRKFIPTLPILARIDGRAFSKFTKPFNKPFDMRMANAMRATTSMLVDKTNACIGYSQSDEITLVLYESDYTSDIMFGGRIQKLTSVLAGMATAFFIRSLDKELVGAPLDIGLYPHFDCRVWQVPSKIEAANTLLWRAQDAKKNGISSACRALYSAKELNYKNQIQMIQMMVDKGVDYYDLYKIDDRLGSFFQRRKFQTLLDDETWNKIPVDNRCGMCRVVTRSSVKKLDMGYFGDYINRPDIIFDSATPINFNDL